MGEEDILLDLILKKHFVQQIAKNLMKMKVNAQMVVFRLANIWTKKMD